VRNTEDHRVVRLLTSSVLRPCGGARTPFPPLLAPVT